MNRTCDGCNMCCYIPGINEPTLQKKEWVMCHNCDVGVGCKIYEQRPKPCRTFNCAWLMGEFPDEWRPDKVGFYAEIEPQGHKDKIMTLYADPHKLDIVEQTLNEWKYITDGIEWRYVIRFNSDKNKIAFYDGSLKFGERYERKS